MFDASATRRAVTSVHAFCEHAANTAMNSVVASDLLVKTGRPLQSFDPDCPKAGRRTKLCANALRCSPSGVKILQEPNVSQQHTQQSALFVSSQNRHFTQAIRLLSTKVGYGFNGGGLLTTKPSSKT